MEDWPHPFTVGLEFDSFQEQGAMFVLSLSNIFSCISGHIPDLLVARHAHAIQRPLCHFLFKPWQFQNVFLLPS